MDKQQSGILNPAQMDAQVAKLQREGRLPPAAEFFKALNSTRSFYKSQMRKAMSGQIKVPSLGGPLGAPKAPKIPSVPKVPAIPGIPKGTF